MEPCLSGKILGAADNGLGCADFCKPLSAFQIILSGMPRIDPIRKNYYSAVERADTASDYLFYFGAVLSVATLFVDQNTHPRLYDVVLIAFALTTLALFVIGIASRLYLTPRAEDKRRQDFFGSAWGVSLTHEQTQGYYNNDQSAPARRMTAQVLENSHFTKSIALRMTRIERVRVGIYATLWVACVLTRRTDLGVVVAASQAVFSEQILAKWLRIEWLRSRCEKVYDDVFKLFQSGATGQTFNAMAMEAVTAYETGKANAAVTLSSKLFEKLNPTLSREWDAIKQSLKI
ncbi:hypothetical protein [Cupriavidus sp. amp6]|uniref:hypothetical protein n=1 Tax=Cupriavidus sp. amp6 TaxID=388051 RepID=UPI001E3CA7B2|nr:hypothetical protein [Cupriavidus sp. amp6]